MSGVRRMIKYDLNGVDKEAITSQFLQQTPF